MSPRSASRRLGTAVVRIAVAGLLVIFVARSLDDIDLSTTADMVKGARVGMVILASAALVARWWFLDLRWREVLRRVPPFESVRPGVRISSILAGVFVNHVTPTARILGGIVRARAVSKVTEGSFAGALGTVLFDQLAHQVVVWSAMAVALTVAAAMLGEELIAVGIATVVAAAIVGGIAAIRSGRVRSWWRRAKERARERFPGSLEEATEAMSVVGGLSRDRGLWARGLLLGAGFVLAYVSAQWLAFLAVGRPVGFLEAAVAACLGSVVGALVGTPGGIGGVEAGTVGTLVILGVGEADAVAATLLVRGLHYGLVIVAGLPALVFVEYRIQRRNKERST